MEVLNFSSEWNGKLKANVFTSFRIHNPAKFVKGSVIEIQLKGEKLFNAVILDVKTVYLKDVNEWVTRLDTGYGKDEFITMVKTMYKNIVKDFSTQKWDLILFLKVKD